MQCACGCLTPVSSPRRYVSGHNLKGLVKTPMHLARIAEGQRQAWASGKRQRKPIGSTRLDANGYVLVKVVESGDRWRKQHILVVEEVIGRPILPGEHVHHINGIKADNRPENLHLFAKPGHHTTAHGSMNALLDQLLREGVITFDRKAGRYRWGSITKTIM